MNGPSDHARGWIAKGDNDLSAARLIIAGGGSLDVVCFLCQQAAEKFVKAVLAYKGTTIPHIHDLGEIVEECLIVCPHLGITPAQVSILTPYAVELRYDLTFVPPPPEAQSAVQTAELVRGRVLAVLPPDAHPPEPPSP